MTLAAIVFVLCAASLVFISSNGNRQAYTLAFAGFPVWRNQRRTSEQRGSLYFLGSIISAVLKPVTTVLGGRYEKDVAKKAQETAQNVEKEKTKQAELDAFARMAEAQALATKTATPTNDNMKKYLLFGGIGIAVLLILFLMLRR